MLDERGLDIESEQMAELIGDAGNTVCSTTKLRYLYKQIHICS